MHPIPRCAAAGVALAAGLSAGCAGDYHFSQLSGKRHFRVPIDTYAVSIVRVDGKDTTFRPALVDPGVRRVTVQGPPGGSGGVGLERTIALDVEPCTRYFLVAVKTNPLAADFTVRVDYSEPVGGCTSPAG
ncbi:MAG: hypothetical protein ABIO71_07945 [Caldimonas sp.]